jgi:hypothetical protein
MAASLCARSARQTLPGAASHHLLSLGGNVQVEDGARMIPDVAFEWVLEAGQDDLAASWLA